MKTAIVCLLTLLTASFSFAQIEGGDTEVSFLGYYSTFLGDDVETNGTGSLQLSYGKYISRHLQIGLAPTFSFSTMENQQGESEINTEISGSAFFSLNFSSSAKTIPYLIAQYYQYTFDIPDEAKFTDFSYATVGLGMKNFFTEYAALNTLVTYGFSLAEEATGGILLISTGLSILF